jgi:hypothetical protein
MHKKSPFLRKNRGEMGTATPWFPAITIPLIFLVGMVGWAILKLVIPLFQDKQVPSAGPLLSADAQAAIAGVSAYYTIDYTEPEGAWRDRMCALLATAEDCLFLQVYLAPAIRATAEKYRVQTTCTVLPLELYSDNGSTMSRIWTLQLTVANPWPGIAPTETVFAEVVFDQTSQEWRFRRILFAQEIQGYVTPEP